MERAHVTEVLEACGWRIKDDGNAAERLGLSLVDTRRASGCTDSRKLSYVAANSRGGNPKIGEFLMPVSGISRGKNANSTDLTACPDC